MKLIIWLWNPWDKYINTKHNIWFKFIDYFSEKYNFPEYKIEKKYNSLISKKNIGSEQYLLIKPQTYMNLSWDAVQKIMHFYKLTFKDVFVIYDDMSMEFWKIRYRNKWSAGWHNGIKNIISNIWEQFNRIKIWIWYDENFDVSDWVLSKISNEENKKLNDVLFNEAYIILKEKLEKN
jgi:PTH1 family peptidyl-tRNA hydrolase